MSVEINGFADLQEWLKVFAPAQAKKLSEAMVMDIAEQMAERTKAHTPVDTGDLVASIKALKGPSKGASVSAGVTARGRGANASHPFGYAFYWRFLEYGLGPDGVEHAMFRRAESEVTASLDGVAFTRFRKRLQDALK